MQDLRRSDLEAAEPGEINVLEPGFGALTFTTATTIITEGVEVGVLTGAGNSVTVHRGG